MSKEILFQKYFVGTSLEEELSFSNYFHKHPNNRLLHVIAIVVGSCLITILFSYGHPLCGVGFATCQFLSYYQINKISALGYLPFLLGSIFSSDIVTRTVSPQLIATLLIMFLLSQLLGHIIWEKAFPAFRFFEAIVSTPVTVMLFTLNSLFGVESDLVSKIEILTPKWKGTERKLLS